MDEAIIKYYRNLIKTGFEFTGSIDDPSILLDYNKTIGVLCGKTGNELRLFVNIHDGVIDEIKYTCICDPVLNVAIEVLCKIAKGKSVIEVKNLSTGIFSEMVGSYGKEFLERSKLALELLNQGITEF